MPQPLRRAAWSLGSSLDPSGAGVCNSVCDGAPSPGSHQPECRAWGLGRSEEPARRLQVHVCSPLTGTSCTLTQS